MKSILKNLWNKIKVLIKSYPVVVAAIIIYLYYLITSINLFQTYNVKRTFIDYLLQFDSLIFMWLAVAAFLQSQKIRQGHIEETIRRFEIEKQFEIQKIHTKVVNEMTTLLQDHVNNPLAVISVTTKEIRRKFETDADIIKWLDRIDSSLQRIHNTIRDIQHYETQKMIEESNKALQKGVEKI
ncbi:MAG: hypothetical protein KJ963_09125 [Bacteroidetes bacterium]|nr:hypothetical protein [Bacteroidota bacterium]MBU1422804.1 hypothetical protein [Bacteroidota bacterium]MBU2637226.1 hypothetical protein [Bacteroidota bacterium]